MTTRAGGGWVGGRIGANLAVQWAPGFKAGQGDPHPPWNAPSFSWPWQVQVGYQGDPDNYQFGLKSSLHHHHLDSYDRDP